MIDQVLQDPVLKAIQLKAKYGLDDALWCVNWMCETEIKSNYDYWNEVFFQLLKLK